MIRLKLERLNRGLSQAMLAYMTGVPQPVISLIETGTWNPNPDQRTVLSRALGIAPDLLLQEVVPSSDAPSQHEATR